MRIAYVCYLNADGHHGVSRKISMQTASWVTAGHDVAVFCVSNGAVELPFEATTRVFSGLRARLRATSDLVEAALVATPDVAYVRYDLFLPPLPRLLRRAATIVEVNSDLGREVALWDDAMAGAGAYERFNRRVILGRAAGIVCTAYELERRVVPPRVSAPRIVIGNGVDLDAFTTLPSPSNDRPRAVYIGFPDQPWQGVDKLLRLAELLPEVDFEIVGFGREALPAEPPTNVRARGLLERREYEAVFAGCDIGIGPLALHRKGLEEAATLKTREYLAYGMPVLIAQRDPDFPDDDRWFFLRIPNTEGNVEHHAAEIGAFARAMRGRRVARHEIEASIGIRDKEARRLAFMRHCAQARR